MLVCLFCRNEWHEARVEEEFGLGEGIDELEGTVIASGAEDIQADAADVLTFKCEACGAEVVVDTAHALNARCHWCRHTLNVNEQIPNGAVPDAVLPFKLTKDEAVERIRAVRLQAPAVRPPAVQEGVRARERARASTCPTWSSTPAPSRSTGARARSRPALDGEAAATTRVTYYAADVYQVERQVSFTVDDLTVEGSVERAAIRARRTPTTSSTRSCRSTPRTP